MHVYLRKDTYTYIKTYIHNYTCKQTYNLHVMCVRIRKSNKTKLFVLAYNAPEHSCPLEDLNMSAFPLAVEAFQAPQRV